ncbi:MAG: thiamine-phosphate kinase [Verrucomicrobiota bacterium]
MDEDQLVRELTALWDTASETLIGPGDDCAVWPVAPQGAVSVAKVDAVAEHVHFRSQDSAARVGHKALGRVLSDFGAMGATPRHALVTIGFPFQTRSRRWLKNCYRGMAKLAAGYQVGLAGGELTQSDQIWISVSLFGYIKASHITSRSGGTAGEALYVTGQLGGSFPRRHLSFKPRLAEGQWLARRGVSAMMDLSDGLGKDLPRLAAASACSYALQPDCLPRYRGCSVEQAVNDGEDYELLFAVSSGKEKRLVRDWPFELPLTRIGELLPDSRQPVTGGVKLTGWDHLCK